MEELRCINFIIAGQDSVGGVNKVFCRQAAGAVIVCDCTDQYSVENAAKWKDQLDDIWCPNDDLSKFPVMLMANKYDLVREYEEESKTSDDHLGQ